MNRCIALLQDKKHIVMLQGLVLLFALWLRWPLAGSIWPHGDEWAFIIHPLGFWSGDFNPHFFRYPTFQLYLSSALYYLYYLLFAVEPLEEFVAYHYFIEDGILLVLARAIVSLASLATVALTSALARRLYGAWAGWDGVERAGPAIKVGYLPLKHKLNALPSARDFFAIVARVLQARQFIERGEWDAGSEWYESVLNTSFYLPELLPFSQYYMIFEDLGYAYGQKGDIQKSLNYWTEALELQPDQAHIYFNIGLIHRALNDLESALYFLRQAQQLDGADSDVLLSMGLCYMEMGQLAESIDYLERSVALKAAANSYIGLGQAYGLAGRLGEQKLCYLKALELAPDHAQAEELRRILRESQL